MQSRRKFVLKHVIIAVFWIRFVGNFCLDKELNKGCLPQRVLRRKVYRFSFHNLIRPPHNFRVLFPVPFLSRFFSVLILFLLSCHLKLLIFDCTKMEFQMFNPVFKHLFVWEFRGSIPFFSFSKLFWLYLQNIPSVYFSSCPLWLVPLPSLIWVTAVGSWLVFLLLLFSHSWFPKGPEGFFKKINQIMSLPVVPHA